MIEVACFCGRRYSFSGDVGVCPQCDEYVTIASASVEVGQPMQHELRPRLEEDCLTNRHALNLPGASVRPATKAPTGDYSLPRFGPSMT